MPASTSITVREEAGVLRAVIAGDISESTDFSPLTEGPPVDTVTLDLRDVRRINSAGVQRWTQFMRRLGTRARRIVLERCATSVVHQIHMIDGFAGRAEIGSFQVPYLCAQCGAESTDLHRPGEPSIPERVPCPSCSAQAELDDLPDVYELLLKGASS